MEDARISFHPALAIERTHPRFASPDADFVIRSSDGTLFRVHKANLGAHSAIFKDMFILGSGNASPDEEPIQLSESAAVLELLLPMFYPAEDCRSPVEFATSTESDILACYEATGKYQMWLGSLALRSFVKPVLKTNPFALINLAHRNNDAILVKKAVKATLEFDILSDLPKHRESTGMLWPDLLEYHLSYQRDVVRAVLHIAKEYNCNCDNCQYAKNHIRSTCLSAMSEDGPSAFPESRICAALKEAERSSAQSCNYGRECIQRSLDLCTNFKPRKAFSEN
ncbi:hypothetical protein BKA62DRAFT_712067 [Auriculariales sp. MPI-PUGE-AT-0066]|nr:hypothetical protein BKA62DRAFT_712067 [Auriculariales sp. MPI-PUGE-AT-0066]